MTELATLFSALLKTYPTLMKPLEIRSSTELNGLIFQAYENLNSGKPVDTPEDFFSLVRQSVSEEDWRLAVRGTRIWGPAADLDCSLYEDGEIELMAVELLWMSAMISELEQRESDDARSPQPTAGTVEPVG